MTKAEDRKREMISPEELQELRKRFREAEERGFQGTQSPCSWGQLDRLIAYIDHLTTAYAEEVRREQRERDARIAEAVNDSIKATGKFAAHILNLDTTNCVHCASRDEQETARLIVNGFRHEKYDVLLFAYGNLTFIGEQLVQHFAAALAESRGVAEQKWQSIETAPKDGTRILICSPLDLFVAHWDGTGWLYSATPQGQIGYVRNAMLWSSLTALPPVKTEK